jgi:hypothetical protein
VTATCFLGTGETEHSFDYEDVPFVVTEAPDTSTTTEPPTPPATATTLCARGDGPASGVGGHPSRSATQLHRLKADANRTAVWRAGRVIGPSAHVARGPGVHRLGFGPQLGTG